jgi:taurine--2-oxoglutarate transaminase
MFWAVELVKDRATLEPLVPFNATGAANAPMNEFVTACKSLGLWPMTHFNRTHVVPPCTITRAEAERGLAMLDDALQVADKHYIGD